METTPAPVTTTAALDLRGPDLDTLAGAWLASLRTSTTRNAYRGDLVAWFGFLDGHGVNPLAATRPVVDAWRLAMETEPQPRTGRPLSPATIARRLAAVSSFYRYARTAGVVAANPVEEVARPYVSADSPTLGLDRAQAVAMLDAARELGPTPYAFLAVMLGCGLRVSEAVALDVADLDTVRGYTVANVTGKGGRKRVVPLAPFVVDAVTAALDGRTSGPVFVDTPRGSTEPQRMTRHRAFYLVTKVAKAAGVPGRITPHSLRHTAATLSLDAGAPLHRVQDFLGHASPVTTQRYNRARQALDGHAAFALAGHLAG